MKLSVGLKVANNLSLTPQLQQAIRLLQLSSLELEQEIQNAQTINGTNGSNETPIGS